MGARIDAATKSHKAHHQRYELAWYDLDDAFKLVQWALDNELYDQARIEKSVERLAATTAIVVTYARPFTEAKGMHRLPEGTLSVLNKAEKELHGELLVLRKKVVAHTDGVHHETTHELSGRLLVTTATLPRLRIFGLPKEDLLLLKAITEKLRNEVRRRQREIERAWMDEGHLPQE